MTATEAREASVLVIGSGMAGLTAAVESLEAGHDVYIVEKEAYLGGRVAGFHKYFPKLCPPACGLEINFRRVKTGHRHLKFFTLAEVENVSGQAGNFNVSIKLNPRFVLADRCTACAECVPVCPVDRPNAFNYGMNNTKAIYLPHEMALPMKYVVDPGTCLGDTCNKCVEVCPTDAIDLHMAPDTLNLQVGSIIVATGWRPYEASKIDTLGFGEYDNVINNVMMERLAAPNGPTRGKLLRPSDGAPAKRVAFVQCAGSRDVNHLPYCSAICCLSSLKEAAYVREQYPDSQVYIFYIDIRASGAYEDFLQRMESDEGIHFIKGKVAKIEDGAEPGDLAVEADDMLAGTKVRVNVDLVVLATGMVPNSAGERIPGLDLENDEFGFALESRKTGVHIAGVVRRPMDVATTVRDGTGAALKAAQSSAPDLARVTAGR
ncbi:MAG: CoB--CoM heterodisulfide reductase iron-sulfur subunit A family protein [Dehalococcoidia bacterium]|nr:CoB--CoM heterodisulfide reductase iron-sulfur subunit A family protein [Dehalococcoidia bacterium]MDP6227902.1 CoB--CoM heterodisulfide reductase iron-sulfur subunit A family protein [Dehalococcoidia bacterium]MDP7085429.1 CoB--CoM heterodisulfide reductase iron-sulfur subunit A family protein [Dehalococcoidia bacterium]MDP7202213.1 CoB--CoM heterodisulfide reductase iron-sulfur subunit A family protein [Dehalococcoidia bacterium]MDP7509814.1 CoB--CoM heterodisulfide reductase iron-sulfur s